ncbi:MAG: hypothetical protein Q8744_00425, partial [Sweet potato little leaf phytoplasma]|nr:hypothetical protein [Sweet potato little leaf phytoplasma]
MLKKYLILQIIKTCFERKKKLFILITSLHLIFFTFYFIYYNLCNNMFNFKKQFFKWCRLCFRIFVKNIVAFFCVIYAIYVVIVL